jgi:hypothetical protein
MRRKRSGANRRRRERGRYEHDARGGGWRPILAQPVDERAPAPDDARLLADLAWIRSLGEGCIPSGRPAPPPG